MGNSVDYGKIAVEACKEGDINKVQMCLTKDIDFGEAFYHAVVNNRLEIAELLWPYTNNSNHDYDHIYCYGLLDIIGKPEYAEMEKFIIQQGISSYTKAMGKAIYNVCTSYDITKYADVIEKCLQKGASANEGLMKAIFYDSLQLARFFLQKGANINYDGSRPLVVAITRKNDVMVEFLKSNGATLKMP